MGRLKAGDAAYYYLAEVGVSTDPFILVVFDSTDHEPPTFAEIVDHVRGRAARIPKLNVRLVPAPLGVSHPSWVEADVRPAERVVDHVLQDDSWTGLQAFVGGLIESRVDVTDCPWAVHVVRGIRDVPLVTGAATVVIFQVSHALADGLGSSAIVRALFAATPDHDPTPARTPASPEKRRGAVSTVVRALLRMPADLVSSRIEGWRANRAFLQYVRDVPGAGLPVSITPATSVNGSPGTARSVSIDPVPLPTFRRDGTTVTVAALMATGTALAAYFDAIGEELRGPINVFVPISVPSSGEPDADTGNHVVLGLVDLRVDVAEPEVRAEVLATALAAERRRVLDPRALALATAGERFPAPIVRAALRRRVRTSAVETDLHAQTNVVSVFRGPANLRLGDSVSVFTAGFPFLGDSRCLTHGFFGLGEVMTVCTVASPGAVPDHQLYARLLHGAVTRTDGDT